MAPKRKKDKAGYFDNEDTANALNQQSKAKEKAKSIINHYIDGILFL
jgi:hypothetical protein